MQLANSIKSKKNSNNNKKGKAMKDPVGYKTKKDFAIKVLGNKCSHCDRYEGNQYLQFDYIPSTKPKYPISKYLSGDVNCLLTEINSYRLLCPSCYLILNKKLPRNKDNARFSVYRDDDSDVHDVKVFSYNTLNESSIRSITFFPVQN
jgi:hypothetical protein